MDLVAPASALVMGLLGGAHCIVMCGGVAGMLSAGLPPEVRARPLRQLPLTAAYNAGRVLSYAAAGFVAGGAGALAGGVVPVSDAQYVLRAVAALTMLAAGLHLAGVFRAFRAVERLGAGLWKRVAPLAARVLPVRHAGHAVVLGLAWGWLPCGMVYSALTLALSAGSGAAGALTMAAFGLGTAPALLAAGTLAGALSRFARARWARPAAGLAMAAFGVLSALTVVERAGWLPFSVPGMPGGGHTHCAMR